MSLDNRVGQLDREVKKWKESLQKSQAEIKKEQEILKILLY